MIVEDVTGILNPQKKYMNPLTKKVHSGEYWLKILAESRYEHIYASDLRSFIEVPE